MQINQQLVRFNQALTEEKVCVNHFLVSINQVLTE